MLDHPVAADPRSDAAPIPDSGTTPGVRERWSARRRARRDGRRLSAPAIEATVRHVDLPQGRVRVREAGSSDRPTLVFVHGLLVDGRVWDGLVARLADRFHCVVPDLPLGSHRTAMHPGADLTPEGVAVLLGDLVEALDLDDVTVVASDSGGAITQLWMDQGAPRVGRVVLTPCDCFDHFLPPGFSFYQAVVRVPGGVGLMLRLTRIRAVRYLPTVYGGLTHRRIDDGLLRSWLEPAMTDAGVRNDAERFLRGISSRRLTAAEERLTRFDRPVLLPWAPEQGWFPITDARRLATLLPDAQVVEIRDSGAFVGLEQPGPLADAIAGFVPAG